MVAMAVAWEITQANLVIWVNVYHLRVLLYSWDTFLKFTYDIVVAVSKLCAKFQISKVLPTLSTRAHKMAQFRFFQKMGRIWFIIAQNLLQLPPFMLFYDSLIYIHKEHCKFDTAVIFAM